MLSCSEAGGLAAVSRGVASFPRLAVVTCAPEGMYEDGLDLVGNGAGFFAGYAAARSAACQELVGEWAGEAPVSPASPS